MRRGRLLILFALILLFGALAVFLFLRNVGGGGTPPAAEGTPALPSDMVEIVIAAQDIPRGAEIPSNGVIAAPFPADSVVETMLTDINQAVGRRARMDIARGVPLTSNMLTDRSGDLLGTGSIAAISIPPGMTAISMPITRLSGVAYAMQDGDSVDVLVSMLIVDLDTDYQTRLPNDTLLMLNQNGTLETGLICGKLEQTDTGPVCTNENPPPFGRLENEPVSNVPLFVKPSEEQRPRLVTQRLIQNARVLHVGTFALPEAAAAVATQVPAAQGAGAPQAETAVTPKIEQPDIVTLIVSPQDALALNWAMKSGVDIALTLRAPGDTTATDTDSVTLQYLIDNYGITVPSKLPYGVEPRLDKIIPPVLPNDQTQQTPAP
jgi:Flp pilus assembly protein CpaB